MMTNYEMIKNFSIENMALSIMCPYEMGHLKSLFRCKEYNGNCSKCCYEWLQEESEGGNEPK